MDLKIQIPTQLKYKPISNSKKESNIDKTTLLITCAIGIGFLLIAYKIVDLKNVLINYQWGVLLIFISMDLFTNILINTGIMEFLALRIAKYSKAQKTSVLVLFAFLLFGVSGFLNNLTATLVILPIIFMLLNAINLTSQYTNSLFALLIAVTNLGGASTPIGDFPAIVIMKSGLTSFTDYLLKAYPLFLFTTGIVILYYYLVLKLNSQERETQLERINREINLTALYFQYRYHTINWKFLIRILICFLGMFISWSMLPPDKFPPEMIALIGFSIAVLISYNNSNLYNKFSLKLVFTIGSFLLIAGFARDSGILDNIAKLLCNNINNPHLLLFTFMLLTAIMTGLFSAGPTAAAMIPIVQYLANGPFNFDPSWLAVAFAASICAGSSLFLWSATAGFLLSQKIYDANLESENGIQIRWGIKEYFKFGIINFLIQIVIGISWIYICI